MKKLIFVSLILFLAACTPSEEDKVRNEKKLPEGCRIIDLDYGDLRAAVVCEGRRTSTTQLSWDQPVDKTSQHHTASVAVIGPQ